MLSKVSLLKVGLSLHLRMTTCDLLCPIEANSERIYLLNVWETNEYRKSVWAQKTQWELLQENSLKYQIYSFNSVEIHLMFVSNALSSAGLPPKQLEEAGFQTRRTQAWGWWSRHGWLLLLLGSWVRLDGRPTSPSLLLWLFLFIASWQPAEPIKIQYDYLSKVAGVDDLLNCLLEPWWERADQTRSVSVCPFAGSTRKAQ